VRLEATGYRLEEGFKCPTHVLIAPRLPQASGLEPQSLPLAFYNRNSLVLLRLSILEIDRGAFIRFAAMVCSEFRETGEVVLKAVSLNLGYRRRASRP
jgi:hypothetical protein